MASGPRKAVSKFHKWGESKPDAAPSNLRTTVHALRKALGTAGGHLIVEDYGSYALRRDATIWVDADAFLTSIEEARAADDPFPLLEYASRLYTSDYLLEDLYEDWAADRRDQVKRAWTDLQFTLARVAKERDEPQRALAALERLVQADACDELAAEELMRLLGQQGRRSAALRVYQRLAIALREDLGVEPSGATDELHKQILRARVTPISLTGRLLERHHNLPAELNSFVGREKQIAELAALLERSRLLTLVGAGGVGKSRLALHVASALLAEFPDVVWLVELAIVAKTAQVVPAVATVLGVADRSGQPLVSALAEALCDRQLLLVLDNCEHLLAACAELCSFLLQMCPGIRILTTSRQPLGVNGETVRRVRSLSAPIDDTPVDLEQLATHEAVRPIVDRVSATGQVFTLTAQTGPAVAEVCRRLEGIPLALELAAARTRVLSVQQVAARLGGTCQPW
jgi:DNA-binding SARP family transcriptional activator